MSGNQVVLLDVATQALESLHTTASHAPAPSMVVDFLPRVLRQDFGFDVSPTGFVDELDKVCSDLSQQGILDKEKFASKFNDASVREALESIFTAFQEFGTTQEGVETFSRSVGINSVATMLAVIVSQH